MPEAKTIHQALNLVMRDVTSVAKTEKNQQQGFSYRGVDSTTKALAPALREHGVVVTPNLLDYSYETVEVGRNKTPMAHVVVKVMYRFYGPAGDHVESTVVAESMDSGDKACAKAMSVAFRVALLQTFALPTDEPDPDSFVYERAGTETPQADAKPASRPAPRAPKAEAPKAAEAATEPDIASFIKMIQAAKTTDQLNKAWTAIGAKGALQTTVVFEGSEVTLEKALFHRADAIKSGKGN